MFKKDSLVAVSKSQHIEKLVEGSRMYQNGKNIILLMKNTDSSKQIFDSLNITSFDLDEYTFLWSENEGKDFHLLKSKEYQNRLYPDPTKKTICFYTSDHRNSDDGKEPDSCWLFISEEEAYVSDKEIEGIFDKSKGMRGMVKSFPRLKESEIKQVAKQINNLLEKSSNLQLPKKRSLQLELFEIEDEENSYVLVELHPDKPNNLVIKYKGNVESIEIKEIKEHGWFRCKCGSAHSWVLKSEKYSEIHFKGPHDRNEQTYLVLKDGKKLSLETLEIKGFDFSKLNIQRELPVDYATPLDALYPKYTSLQKTNGPGISNLESNNINKKIILQNPGEKFKEKFGITVKEISKNQYGEWIVKFNKDFNEKNQKSIGSQLMSSVKGITFQKIPGIECKLIIPKNSADNFEQLLDNANTIKNSM